MSLKSKKSLFILAIPLVLATAALGYWVSNIIISANLAGSGGVAPVGVFAGGLNVPAGTTGTFDKTFVNTGDALSYDFTLDSSTVVSTNPACEWMNYKDVVTEMAVGAGAYQILSNTPVTFEMVKGDNIMHLKFTAAATSCPFGGMFTINGIPSD